jgi:hypothetical protein
MGRYNNRKIFKNEDPSYMDNFMDKELRFINQYDTLSMMPMTLETGLSIERITHIWSHGDRLWKLSEQYYGNPSYWWLIAWFNRKPTENHYSIGDTVIIPIPFERALSLYNRGS